MTRPTAADRLTAWLSSLSPERLHALAEDFASGLEHDGLTVYRGDEDRFVPIPPALTPEPIDDADLGALADEARRLLSAAVKTARWTLSAEDATGRAAGERLYRDFTPLEWAALRRDPGRLARVATARVDYFRAQGGQVLALELNATIPAMQGYSDLIAHRWLRTIAAALGHDRATAERLVHRTGSNTADLLASLLAHHRALGGRDARPAVAIVSRRGDAQLGELRHYERAFTEAGLRARHVWVDELDRDADGAVIARGERFELVYRHIFARRVEPGTTMAELLVDPGGVTILNPVLSPLEVKGLLAVLHQAATLGEPAAVARALDDDERAAVVRGLPWTRLLQPGPGDTPDGERVVDLPAWVAAHPERVVIKRSWDYGGKGVFLGPDAGTEGDRARMADLYGEECRGWKDLVARAAVDPHAWVAQALVPPRPTRHLLLSRDDQGRVNPVWREVFVDLNAYANLGVDARPRGGVCRASGSKIVNILGGGGLAPLIPSSVLDELAP